MTEKRFFTGDFDRIRTGSRVAIHEASRPFNPDRPPPRLIPIVETSPRVDVDLLTQGDDDPYYITQAVFEVDAISDNGLIYDEETVRAIEEQLIGAGGIRGHLGMLDFSAYPPDAIEWVGVMRDNRGVTWAKGYIPPGETREQIRIKQAVGAPLGTSIFAYAEPEEVDENTWRAQNIELITLDLVHPKRAALKMGLWSGFRATSEMADTAATPPPEKNSIKEETSMKSTKSALIALLQTLNQTTLSNVLLTEIVNVTGQTAIGGHLTTYQVVELARRAEALLKRQAETQAETQTEATMIIPGVDMDAEDEYTPMLTIPGIDPAPAGASDTFFVIPGEDTHA